MICPNCGFDLPAGVRFCKNCGCKIEDAQEGNRKKTVTDSLGTEYISREPVKNIQVDGAVHVGKVIDQGKDYKLRQKIAELEKLLLAGDFETATDYSSKLVYSNPKNGELYLYQLLCELHLHKRENLKYYPYPLEDNPLYQKAFTLGNEEIQKELGEVKEFMHKNALSGRKSIARMSIAELKDLKKGAEFDFGMTSKGAVRWKVIEEDSNGFTAIMKDIFCKMNYWEEDFAETKPTVSSAWEVSLLKAWLENEFLTNYFDKTEISVISEVSVFTLEEVNHYFPTEKERSLGKDWFIKNPGGESYVQQVFASGKISEKYKPSIVGGVRPYLQIDRNRICLENDFYAEEAVVRPEKCCPECQTMIPEEARFCCACGALQLAGKCRDGMVAAARNHLEKLASLKSGEVFEYGMLTYGIPLKWRVLEKRENMLLAFCENSVGNRPFGGKNVTQDWESSSIRKWLNEGFLYQFLTLEEQTAIVETVVEKKKKTAFGEKTYGETKERVFLLSVEQCRKYKFSSVPGGWWTCTIGKDEMVVVCEQFSFSRKKSFDQYYGYYQYGIRPAMWLKIR